MKLKNILLCTIALLVLTPAAVFAKGPCFSLSLNMFTPPRPCVVVRPCPPPPPPPPPCVVTYYPTYVVYPHHYPYVVSGHHHVCHHHGYYGHGYYGIGR